MKTLILDGLTRAGCPRRLESESYQVRKEFMILLRTARTPRFVLAFSLACFVFLSASGFAESFPADSAAPDVEEFPRMYVIGSREDGGTLSGVARLFYGDARRWRTLFEHNRKTIEDPDQISPGMEILIPRLETLALTGELVSVRYDPRLYDLRASEVYQVRGGPHDRAFFTLRGSDGNYDLRVNHPELHRLRLPEEPAPAAALPQPPPPEWVAAMRSLLKFTANKRNGAPELPIPQPMRVPPAVRASMVKPEEYEGFSRTLHFIKAHDNVWELVRVENHALRKAGTVDESGSE